MKAFTFIAGIVLFTFASACSDKIDDLKKMAESAEKSVAEYQERQASGDTNVMHYKDLQQYLPEEIEGYTREAPEGTTTKHTGFKLSTAKARYIKDNGEGGRQKIDVEIVDYNAAGPLWMGATALLAFDVETDNAQKFTRTFVPDFPESRGFEQFHKKSGKVELFYALNKRFFVKIIADKQENTDFAKELAHDMRLAELAEM